ncbi:MAG: FtsH protease activity modulator HflK [Planctomycetota bacterium]|jgi:membrane protease subunit HflK
MDSLPRWEQPSWNARRIAPLVGYGVAALIVIAGLFSSYYTVGPEEEAVVLRFGRYKDTKGPGLHFKIPFGVDDAINVPVTEVRNLEFGFRTVTPGRRSVYSSNSTEALMLTGDLNIADVEWVIQYKINDAKKWLFSIREQEDAIRDLSESVMRAVVGDRTATEVFTGEREAIAVQARERLQKLLDYYKIGVDIVTIKLQNSVPPPPVQPSFNEVNAAQQEARRIENEAQREYLKVIEVAKGEAKRELAEADGYAIDRTNRAKGDVARFRELVAAYSQSKEVTRRRLYLEAMERILPRVKRIVVADESGILKMLPLGEGK